MKINVGSKVTITTTFGPERIIPNNSVDDMTVSFNYSNDNVKIVSIKVESIPIISSVSTTSTDSPNLSVLESPNKQYRLRFDRNDGNLSVIKNSDRSTLWSIKNMNNYTPGLPGPYQLIQQTDGNLVVYSSNYESVFSALGTNKWNRPGDPNPPYTIELQDTGILKITDKNNVVIWTST